MGGVVDLGQVLKIEMGVDLRRANVGVAEQLLDRAQITGRFQQVAGERMAQHVRMDMARHALFDRPLAQPRLDCARAEAAAASADEQRRFAGRSEQRTYREPGLDSRVRHASDRHAPRLAALARDIEQPVVAPHIADVQRHQL